MALVSMFVLTTNISPTLAAGEMDLREKSENTITAKDIVFYKTISDNPEQESETAMKEHEEAINIIEDYIKTKGYPITSDINDVTYQQFVISLGTAFDEFSEKDMKIIIPFIQFIDLYENHSKNDTLKQYKNKLNSKTTLSEQENMDLSSLIPASPNATSTEENVAFSINEQISDNAISPATVYSNGYNNIAARDYAYKWWNGRNPLYDYYASKQGCSISDKNCWAKWNDCANFVSQALYAGGMKMKYGPSYTHSTSWSYGVVPSYTWGGAHNFYTHWKTRAGVANSSTALQTGDAVSADFTKDGDIDHTALITKNTGNASNQKFLTQHTTDRKETTTLANWYNSGYSVYGYEIDKAAN